MKKIFLFILLSIYFFPFLVLAQDDNYLENAVSGVLIEASTGKIIYEKDKDLELPIASMTKMVSQIIILENMSSIWHIA